MATNIQQVERQTVQEFEPKDSLGAHYIWTVAPGFDMLNPSQLLPAWGVHYRDRVLREKWYRGQYSWLAQSAVASVVRKAVQTPWEMQGGRNLTTYYQRLLQDAHFMQGWDTLLSLVLLDYLTCDYGAYVEIIGAGQPDQPLRGRVTGIAHLDSLRCVPTGNNEYPVVYYSRMSGKLHRLHHTRVARLIDMPDGDELRHGGGLSALSRAVSIIAQQMPMQEYVRGMLSDTPASGILYNAGITSQQWGEAYNEYQARRQTGYKGFMVLNSTESDMSGELVNFQLAPEGFDYGGYLEIMVNAVSAAFGIDRQDIWPLTGKMAGTATQSQVLADKANGQMHGDILKKLERLINLYVLPPALEFSFKHEDDESDQMRADRNSVIINQAMMMRGVVSDEQVVRYIANQSEEWRDVLTDEDGEIIQLPDDDVRTDEQTADVEPAVVGETDGEADETDVTTDTEATGERAVKAIQATRLDFEDTLEDIFNAAMSGSINRRRFSILMRGAISRAGQRAYRDGLEDGGVTDATLSDEDRARISVLTAEQNKYVSNLGAKLFSGEANIYNTEAKAALWFNKSIDPFYQAGKLSADANGNYEFVLGSTEEHCDSCLTANGQIHRLKAWHRSGKHPRSSQLQCGGWRCDCRLVKTAERARGRLTRIKEHTHGI